MAKDDMEIVSDLRLAIAEKVGRQRFDLWFGAKTRLDISGESLRVMAASQFKRDWLRKQFHSELQEVCRAVLGPDSAIEFGIDQSLEEFSAEPAESTPAEKAAVRPDPLSPGQSPQEKLRSRRRFASLDRFVVGDSNRVAYTSAKMISEQLGEISPLFIHGPSGVGKTHLLEGIWASAKRESPRRRLVYLSAEQFTSYFLEALRGGGLPSFRQKYRHLDLLIIDDVQFFVGKKATLVELQHTIDTVLREGKQVVFSASRPPGHLAQVGPELMTRMTGGLVCGVRQPEMATRLGIVRQIVVDMSLSLPENVVEHVATHLIGDARQLSGALCRLKATSQALQKPITLSLAEEALTDLVCSSRHAVRLSDIERAVCEVFGLDPHSLQGSRKHKSISHPRMLAMWLARKHTRTALAEIGGYFGRRSHATVISAQKKVKRWMADGEPMHLADRSWKIEEAIQQIESKLHTA